MEGSRRCLISPDMSVGNKKIHENVRLDRKEAGRDNHSSETFGRL
jgi:hypothetical protein